MTQNDAILALLKQRGEQGLTPLEALDLTGSFRLAARVGELRADGWVIENRGSGHGRYVLIGDATPWMGATPELGSFLVDNPEYVHASDGPELEQMAVWGDR